MPPAHEGEGPVSQGPDLVDIGCTAGPRTAVSRADVPGRTAVQYSCMARPTCDPDTPSLMITRERKRERAITTPGVVVGGDKDRRGLRDG